MKHMIVLLAVVLAGCGKINLPDSESKSSGIKSPRNSSEEPYTAYKVPPKVVTPPAANIPRYTAPQLTSPPVIMTPSLLSKPLVSKDSWVPARSNDYLVTNRLGHPVGDRFRLILPKSTIKAYEVGEDRDLVLQKYHDTIHGQSSPPTPQKEKDSAQKFLDYAARRFLFEKGGTLSSTKNLDTHEFSGIVVPEEKAEKKITDGGIYELKRLDSIRGADFGNDYDYEMATFNMIDSQKETVGVFYLFVRNDKAASAVETLLTVRNIQQSLGVGVKVEKIPAKSW